MAIFSNEKSTSFRGAELALYTLYCTSTQVLELILSLSHQIGLESILSVNSSISLIGEKNAFVPIEYQLVHTNMKHGRIILNVGDLS